MLMTRRTLIASLPALAAPLPLMAQRVADLASTEALLKKTSERFLGLIEPVSEEQWNFRVLTIKHTIGEEAEHVALSEQDLQKLVIRALRAPKDETYKTQLAGKEWKVKDLLLDEEKMAENYDAPNRLRSKEEVVEFYGAAEEKLMALLNSGRELTMHAAKHPDERFGHLSALQWFHYMAYHAERHCQQIEALQGHPDYPGRRRTA